MIVIGGGHAGAEAAYVSAKGGLSTLLVTQNLDTIGQMSCNPAIGGTAKGHIVREIDALGGMMASVIDRTGIHFKMLNRSRGPAIWSPRAQAEKKAYQNHVKWTLEALPCLSFYQDICESLLIEDNTVLGIETGRKGLFYASYVILTTGTFLKGKIHIGNFQQNAGRISEASSIGLSECLTHYQFSLGRMKTGTPPRVLRRSIDFSCLIEQFPDEPPLPFSFATEAIKQRQTPCWIGSTNPKTHEIIRKNLDLSPIYSGQIQSKGPRYCPSIEDKVVRFQDKESHQIFVEPEGMETGEIYLNGISTSLPEDIQWKLVRSCQGFEQAEIIRPGYAVEYDHVDPRQLHQSLETKKIKHLYFAGQINGTTGYEEAAAQGLMAGINVLRVSQKRLPLILSRAEAYIGVLIDDLVLKGVQEPYRMFTSRAENRLLLRQDNSDQRLMKYGKELGLVDDTAFSQMQVKYKKVQSIRKSFDSTGVRPIPHLYQLMERKGLPVPDSLFGKSVAAFLRRPEIKIEDCSIFIQKVESLDSQTLKILEMEIKYEGYIRREKQKIERLMANLSMRIPIELDYENVRGMKREAVENLQKMQPSCLDAASRISGVTSSDIDLLHIYLQNIQDSSRERRSSYLSL